VSSFLFLLGGDRIGILLSHYTASTANMPVFHSPNDCTPHPTIFIRETSRAFIAHHGSAIVPRETLWFRAANPPLAHRILQCAAAKAKHSIALSPA